MTTSQKNYLAGALVAAGFALVFWRVFGTLVMAWYTDDNYSHGFLIIPVAAYLAWERRDRFWAAAGTPNIFGLVIVVGSLLVLTGGILGSELFMTRIAIVGSLVGVILFLFGWARLRVLLFPMAMLLLMIPIPAIIFNQLAFPLQIFASRVGEGALEAANIPVLREGNVLILANTTLEVAEACSGIRSLVSLITLAIVFGYFSDPRSWVRVLITASAIPIAVVTNGARVAGTGIAAHYYGAGAADGLIHEFAGWLVFISAFALLGLLQQLIARITPQPSPAASVVVAV
ncbi:MAG: eight transrane protein EpsH [Acidobacteria bacterium]|nr:eight transrane protein EpsH [Acidobacteriota bacterium]